MRAIDDVLDAGGTLAFFAVRTGDGFHAVIGHHVLVSDIRELVMTGHNEEDAVVRNVLMQPWFPHGHGKTTVHAMLDLQRRLDAMTPKQFDELTEVLHGADEVWDDFDKMAKYDTYLSLRGENLTPDCFSGLTDLYDRRLHP